MASAAAAATITAYYPKDALADRMNGMWFVVIRAANGRVSRRYFEHGASYTGYLYANYMDGAIDHQAMDSVIDAASTRVPVAITSTRSSKVISEFFQTGVSMWRADRAVNMNDSIIYASEPSRSSMFSSPASRSRFILIACGNLAATDISDALTRIESSYSEDSMIMKIDVAAARADSESIIPGYIDSQADFEGLMRSAGHANAGEDDPYLILDYNQGLGGRSVVATDGNELLYAGMMYQLLMPYGERGVSDVMMNGRLLSRREMEVFFEGAASSLRRAAHIAVGGVVRSDNLPVISYWSSNFSAVLRKQNSETGFLFISTGGNISLTEESIIGTARQPLDPEGAAPSSVVALVRRVRPAVVAGPGSGNLFFDSPEPTHPARPESDWNWTSVSDAAAAAAAAAAARGIPDDIDLWSDTEETQAVSATTTLDPDARAASSPEDYWDDDTGDFVHPDDDSAYQGGGQPSLPDYFTDSDDDDDDADTQPL